jgi:hypothetical protein
LPPLLEGRGVRAEYFRATVTLGLLIGFAQLWQDSQFAYGDRTALVSQGADRMLVFNAASHPSGVTLGRVNEWIQTNTPAQSTLAVLPDGSILNYLSRRDNPTGYLRWNPTESTEFGEENMTHAFMRAQPDYIILIEFDLEGFDIKPFGQDPHYGFELKRWLDAHYRPVYQTGPPKVIVYQRKPAGSAAGTREHLSDYLTEASGLRPGSNEQIPFHCGAMTNGDFANSKRILSFNDKGF